jgi:ADP-heptose:LPS heptosyltransferase
LGDIIIFSSFIHFLKATDPNAKIFLAIRNHYKGVSQIIPGVEYFIVDLPYSGEYNKNTLSEFLDRIKNVPLTQIVYSTHNITWIDKEIYKKFSHISSYSISPYFQYEKKVKYIEVDEREPEWNKYKKLALEWNPGRQVEISIPKIELKDEDYFKINDLLQNLSLVQHKYVCWNPSGIANFSAKNWSLENHISLIKLFLKKSNLKILLIGSEKEKHILDHVKGSFNSKLKERIQIFTSNKDDSLLVVSFLIRNSKLFIGNDTGTTHLAAALSIPIFSVFGGGTWPRFIPLSSKKLIITNQIECYGCNWNCSQKSILCLESIPWKIVREYFIQFIEFNGEMDQIVDLKTIMIFKLKNYNIINKIKKYLRR